MHITAIYPWTYSIVMHCVSSGPLLRPLSLSGFLTSLLHGLRCTGIRVPISWVKQWSVCMVDAFAMVLPLRMAFTTTCFLTASEFLLQTVTILIVFLLSWWQNLNEEICQEISLSLSERRAGSWQSPGVTELTVHTYSHTGPELEMLRNSIILIYSVCSLAVQMD